MSTPISRDGIDHALRARRAEQDRISESLLTLESNTTYQLLDGSALRGATLARWSAAKDAAGTMWALNDAYRRTLRQAEDVRARRAKAGPQELMELSELLIAASIAIPSPGPRPLTLLPAPDERISLDEVVDRMESAFAAVMEVVEAVDAVWSAAFPRLDQAAAAVKEARDLAAELGESPGLGSLEEELRAMREAVLLDPLGPAVPSARLEQVLEELRSRLADLRTAAALMREYGRRKELLSAAIARVGAADQQARLAHTEVAAKILLPPTARPGDRAGELRAELESIDVSVEGWSARADRLRALEGRAAQAEQQSLQRAGALRGLLGRREELRGRLHASQAKAVRKRLAEDPEAIRLYDEARLLLWTAPCDLNRAAQLVERYSREVNR